MSRGTVGPEAHILVAWSSKGAEGLWLQQQHLGKWQKESFCTGIWEGKTHPQIADHPSPWMLRVESHARAIVWALLDYGPRDQIFDVVKERI